MPILCVHEACMRVADGCVTPSRKGAPLDAPQSVQRQDHTFTVEPVVHNSGTTTDSVEQIIHYLS